MGSRGQCEGEACCSLFPCPSKPPCAGLNTSFSHRSVCPPGREEVPSLVCVLCLSEGLPALSSACRKDRLSWVAKGEISRDPLPPPQGNPPEPAHASFLFWEEMPMRFMPA